MRACVGLLFLVGSYCCGQQGGGLPAAPAPETKPVFTLPKTGLVTYGSGAGQVAPPTPDVEEVCGAPAEGLYAKQPEMTPVLKRAMQGYLSVMQQRVGVMFDHNMPWAAKDAWAKKARVRIRFAILPNGSIDTPLITMTSGHDVYDRHAYQAIQQASPFDPLPTGIGHAFAVCYTFGYHSTEEDFAPKAKDPLPYAKPDAGPAKP